MPESWIGSGITGVGGDKRKAHPSPLEFPWEGEGKHARMCTTLGSRVQCRSFESEGRRWQWGECVLRGKHEVYTWESAFCLHE